MENKEILEANTLIAIFMGAKPCKNFWNEDALMHQDWEHSEWSNRIQDNFETTAYKPNQLEYHSSWDWLMPVVEKIAKDYDFNLWSTNDFWACNISRQDVSVTEHPIGDMGGAEPIYCVYKAVIQFLTWYNNNKYKHTKP